MPIRQVIIGIAPNGQPILGHIYEPPEPMLRPLTPSESTPDPNFDIEHEEVATPTPIPDFDADELPRYGTMSAGTMHYTSEYIQAVNSLDAVIERISKKPRISEIEYEVVDDQIEF